MAFDQVGGSLTYTFGANTFFTASVGRSSTVQTTHRDLARADMLDPTAWPSDKTKARYQPPTTFTYPGLLDQAFNFEHGYDTPPNLDFATNPDSVIFRSPFGHPSLYYVVPTETKFVSKTFEWEHRDYITRRDTVLDSTYTVRVVSPQGYSPIEYKDLTGLFQVSGGAEAKLDIDATQLIARADLTHVIGSHTAKIGAEYIGRDIAYHYEHSGGLIGPGRHSKYRE